MDEELTPSERQALADLGAMQAPNALEDRVVSAVHREGLITTPNAAASAVLRAAPNSNSRRAIGLAVAASLVFVTGIVTQRFLLPDRAPSAAVVEAAVGDRYLLLLLEPAEALLDPATEDARVAEYGAWAAEMAGQGLLEAGEKLADGGEIVGAEIGGPPPTERVTGFFIVNAADAAAAVELARDNPHVRHGGRIAVRRIEPT
jgi:hypothetical protein